MGKIASTVKAVGFSALLCISVQPAMAGETEDQVRDYCLATGQVQPWAFARCMGQNLTAIELGKIPSGDAFGENNTGRKIIERPGKALEDLGKSLFGR